MLGAGKMGRAIALLLLEHGSGYQVRVADQGPRPARGLAELGCETLLVDVTDENSLAAALQGSWAVLNALPFSRAVRVAGLAASLGVHYFDLTEDVRSTQAISRAGPGAPRRADAAVRPGARLHRRGRQRSGAALRSAARPAPAGRRAAALPDRRCATT